MKVKELVSYIEELFPLAYQESYDNCGLIIGDVNMEMSGALICFDVNEKIVDEAIENSCNVIISHHPFIFKGIKRINNETIQDKIIRKAIQNNVAIYAAHTNVDNSIDGINRYAADLLSLKHLKILKPIDADLYKIVVFCPEEFSGKVRDALFKAGCGNIGNYDRCSFNTEGFGTFRASEKANPFAGKINEYHFEKEFKIETIVPKYLLNHAIHLMVENHPYEEVAYDVMPLFNKNQNVGAGIIGNLEKPIILKDFFEIVKEKLGVNVLRHNSSSLNTQIQRIAYCGGSGSFLINDAIRSKADIFITGDVKYHDFFDAQNSIVIADIGHFESEHFIQDILFDRLTNFFPKFAVLKTKIITNPVNYV